jgi:hypothetical protein
MDGEVHGVASLAYRRSLEVGKKRWMRTVCSGACGWFAVGGTGSRGWRGRQKQQRWMGERGEERWQLHGAQEGEQMNMLTNCSTKCLRESKLTTLKKR